MIDIKTLYSDIVALQPTTNKAPLTPLQQIEELERRRPIDVDAPNGRYVGLALAPSPALISKITPGTIKASISYDASSGEGFESGHSVDYPILTIEYDLTFDDSLYEQVRLIHDGALVQAGGEILNFSYRRHDNNTIKGNPWRSYDFRIALRLSHISLLKNHPTASVIGATAPRNTDCFVATAAFGHRDQSEVVALRRFRDETLSGSRTGRLAVRAYERLSPPIAATIRGNRVLAHLTRTLLKQLVVPFLGYASTKGAERLASVSSRRQHNHHGLPGPRPGVKRGIEIGAANMADFDCDNTEAFFGDPFLTPVYFGKEVLIRYLYDKRFYCDFASDTYGPRWTPKTGH